MLRGSKTEHELRSILTNSHDFIFHCDAGSTLKDILINTFPDLKTAYILNHIPEQAEDIYKVLVNNENLISVEINRLDTNVLPIIKILNLKEFKKHLSNINQVKLALAIELGNQDLEKV